MVARAVTSLKISHSLVYGFADPLDSSQEAVAAAVSSSSSSGAGSPDSRYMTRLARRKAPTSASRRRDISITSSAKYGSGSSSRPTSWQGRSSVFPGLSFEARSKNYLPLGALQSSDNTRSDIRSNLKSTGRSASNHSPLRIPLIPFPQMSTPIPIPVPLPQEIEVIHSNPALRSERRLFSPQISTPKPIPVSISQNNNVVSTNVKARGQRKIGSSRNLVRILPQRFKPGYSLRRNSTAFKVKKPEIAKVQLKNWPNEALQNVQDLFNYEKYTSFIDDEILDRNKVQIVERPPEIPIKREPSIKSPDVQQPIRWSKIPIVEPTSTDPPYNPNDRIDVGPTMHIDNLLGDLTKKNENVQHQPMSQVSQNTIVHILNAASRKPNVTVVEPASVPKSNKTKTGGNRPPQNVHIMFMTDKDEASANQSSPQQRPPAQILGSDTDCPTIMINSITQINNTIESKEGCTDLNIVINSHVLNTNIFKPPAGTQPPTVTATEALKDPYANNVSNPPSNYQSYTPQNNYQNSNYNGGYKEPSNEVQSDQFAAPQPTKPEISTFEVFQGTHINIGGGGQSVDDTEENSGESGSDDSTGNNADGEPLSNPEEGTNDVTGTSPEQPPNEEVTSNAGPSAAEDTSAVADAVTQAGQSSEPIQTAGDVATAQANDAPGAISLPSLPNVPNLSGVPGQVSNAVSNLAGGGPGGSRPGGGGPGGGGQTSLASIAGDDDDDDEDLLDALSPVNLLESISSVFTYFSVLNPINYGIFGMAVAPFVAFAAGLLGVAAFLFPWAFPGGVDLARSWDYNGRVRVPPLDPHLREIVHSSMHQYRPLNEWKGRRRKRKRKR